jgi:antirestriction protein
MLVGEWYDAQTADEVTPDDVHTDGGVGQRYYCEELWVLDHEGLPISGECSPTTAAEWARLLAEVDEWQRGAFLAWVRAGSYWMDGDGLPSVSDFEDAYAGEWESFREYAGDYADSIGLLSDVPELVATYFDWDAWARDLAYDFTTEPAPGGGIFVFRSL